MLDDIGERFLDHAVDRQGKAGRDIGLVIVHGERHREPGSANLLNQLGDITDSWLGAIVGPAGNFAVLPAEAKWVMSLAMIAGRLELFAILVLFSRRFWRSVAP